MTFKHLTELLGQNSSRYIFKPMTILCLAWMALSPTLAVAQTRAMRIIVPYAAGGPIDATARLMAERVKDTLGTVIIDNKPGGGGNIGADAIAKAAQIGRASCRERVLVAV